MSNGAATAIQANSANAPWNASGYGTTPNVTQQWAAPVASGSGFGNDQISTSNESIVPPLLANTAPNDAQADNVVDSQVPGMGAIALIGAGIAVFAFFLVPLAFELNNSRAKLKRELYVEKLEHNIHDAHRSAKDSTGDWVDEIEKMTVSSSYLKAMTADMRGTWDRLHSADPKEREAAETRAMVLEMPIEAVPGKINAIGGKVWRLKGVEQTGAFHPAEPSSAGLTMTALHAHAQLTEHKAAGFADKDHLRMFQEQVNILIGELFGEVRVDYLAQGRAERFRKHLSEWHKSVQAKFVAEANRSHGIPEKVDPAHKPSAPHVSVGGVR